MNTENAYIDLVTTLNDVAIPFYGDRESLYTGLLEKIGDARFILIGEATHGTHEFYDVRAEITRRLITEKNFMAVAIEGDWPDAYNIHRYIQGELEKEQWAQSLGGFSRFPTWMWRNKVISSFIRWMRDFNDNKKNSTNKIGFYGLDLYSLHASMQAVIEYLEKVDSLAAERAKARYSCFDHLNVDPQAYGHLTTLGIKKSCIKEAIMQLLEMQHRAFEYVHNNHISIADEYFYATQNARLVKNAEIYYRSLFEDPVSSWNVRDLHMMETLNTLSDHLENRFNKPAKIIIWAHNSHVGDARATEMGQKGEINIGQLVREQHDADTYLIGFSTYEGFVTAASEWDGPAETKPITPGLPGSYEALFHDVKYPEFLLHLTEDKQLEHFLNISRLQRAIGVVYRPETERLSHYFFTYLPYQFDSLIHLDQTTAIKPLD